tara:strand:+ start:973 stop:1107 length:135 start_codon:yes stop_codon:yes gene_type:complete
MIIFQFLVRLSLSKNRANRMASDGASKGTSEEKTFWFFANCRML